MSQSPGIPNYTPAKKFPWGCLLGGCATVLLLMLVLVIGSGVAGFYFYKGQVAKYTSESAKELPTVEYLPEEIEEITQRVESFKSSLEKGETPEQIVLSADDLNALISQQEDLRGKLFVRIDDGQVTADVSVPADMVPWAKGRYFNGSVSANVSLESGILIVTLADAEVNGQKVPGEFMDAMKKENLVKELYKNPDVAKALGKFESLLIDKDKIILTPKELPQP